MRASSCVRLRCSVTTTDSPGRMRGSVAAGPSSRIFTGTRCVTFVKLPVALSGGSSANCAPVAGDRLSMRPLKVRCGSASKRNCTASPVRTLRSCVSRKLATIHGCGSTSVSSAWPGATCSPVSTVFLPT
jgi:hypothetical protein